MRAKDPAGAAAIEVRQRQQTSQQKAQVNEKKQDRDEKNSTTDRPTTQTDEGHGPATQARRQLTEPPSTQPKPTARKRGTAKPARRPPTASRDGAARFGSGHPLAGWPSRL